MIIGEKTSSDQRQRIRTVFLRRRDSYRLGEVAWLTGFCREKLRREVRAGLSDGSMIDGVWVFTWRQLVGVALRQWSLAEIHDALGEDAAIGLPPLLALRSVTVRLPEYVVR